MTVLMALAAFALITLVMLGIEITTTYATRGFGFGFSANRAQVEKSGLPLRISRAYQNQVESAAYIVPALGFAALAGLETAGVHLAALLIIIGRVGFGALYYTGIPFIRVPAFVLGTLGSLYIVAQSLMMS